MPCIFSSAEYSACTLAIRFSKRPMRFCFIWIAIVHCAASSRIFCSRFATSLKYFFISLMPVHCAVSSSHLAVRESISLRSLPCSRSAVMDTVSSSHSAVTLAARLDWACETCAQSCVIALSSATTSGDRTTAARGESWGPGPCATSGGGADGRDAFTTSATRSALNDDQRASLSAISFLSLATSACEASSCALAVSPSTRLSSSRPHSPLTSASKDFRANSACCVNACQPTSPWQSSSSKAPSTSSDTSRPAMASPSQRCSPIRASLYRRRVLDSASMRSITATAQCVALATSSAI
mmetsp:Transcript_8027/g.18633  ORF Transcript_8027/g.18633 Transcript_8027/m.18633 type:complete len:297 (-) Transcript_8027:1114-2004(-)